MKRNTNLQYWPAFLHPIFFALGVAMAGRQLHPNTLKNLPPVDDDILLDHRWQLRHLSGEDAKPGRNRYVIAIAGPRIDGMWTFRSGELAILAREAVAVEIVTPHRS